jgi:hypothetical protein
VCAQVWDFCDNVKRTDGDADVTVAVIKKAAVDKGWNLNNAQIEMYAWRKFNGVPRAGKAKAKGKRAAKAAPPVAPEVKAP